MKKKSIRILIFQIRNFFIDFKEQSERSVFCPFYKKFVFKQSENRLLESGLLPQLRG